MDTEPNTQAMQTINPADITLELASSRYDMLEAVVRATLIEGVDYGFIDGIPQPFLLKPGAWKLIGRFQLRAIPTLLDFHEDWEKAIFNYRYQAIIVNKHGEEVARAERACTNMEDKFLNHWQPADEPKDADTLNKLLRSKKGRYKKDNHGEWWEEKVTKTIEERFACVPDCVARAQKRAIVEGVVATFSAAGFFANEATKKKARTSGGNKEQNGATKFWLRVKELGFDEIKAKEIAEEARTSKITWEQAIGQIK